MIINYRKDYTERSDVYVFNLTIKDTFIIYFLLNTKFTIYAFYFKFYYSANIDPIVNFFFDM